MDFFRKDLMMVRHDMQNQTDNKNKTDNTKNNFLGFMGFICVAMFTCASAFPGN